MPPCRNDFKLLFVVFVFRLSVSIESLMTEIHMPLLYMSHLKKKSIGRNAIFFEKIFFPKKAGCLYGGVKRWQCEFSQAHTAI